MNKEIRAINRIVEQAVLHGGDTGGSYGSNRTGLTNALNIWIEVKELKDKYAVKTIMTSNGRIPQIVELS